MEPTQLTASQLCRTALISLQKARENRSAPPRPPYASRFYAPVKGLFGALAFVLDDALAMDLDDFRWQIIDPLMAAWSHELGDTEMGSEYLLLPLGVLGAANERFCGTAMRCVIVEDHPVLERDVPSRVTRYYDISTDEFKDGPCSMAVSFWVHTPDTDARLSPDE